MANPPQQAGGRNRRAAVRYPVNPENFGSDNSCRPITAQPTDAWSAMVRDMSTGGVGLVVNRRFEPGTLLIVEVHDAEQTVNRSLLVRVVHVVREEDNTWFLGCCFPTAMTEAELLSLM